MEPQFAESAHPNPIERPRKGERRFRIVKLEERIAPSRSGHGYNAQNPVHHTHMCLCYRSASGH